MRILLVIFLLISGIASGQYKYIISADSTLFRRVGGGNELIIENSTKATTGVLVNYGNGRTRFSKPRINGDTLFIGVDTILGVGVAGGATNSNLGAGYRLAIPNTNNIKTLGMGYGMIGDSATANQIVIRVDTTGLLANYWGDRGNAGTNRDLDFIGTSDNQALTFRVNNVRSGFISTPTYGGLSTLFGYQANGYSGATAFGYRALAGGGDEGTIAVGLGAMQNNNAGFRSLAIGYYANERGKAGLENSWGGAFSGEVNSTGSYNSAWGSNTLRANREGNYNIAMGNLALVQNTTGISVSIATAGSGQTDGVYPLTITAPETGSAGVTATQATANVTISGGVAVSVTNTNPGRNYSTENAPITAVLTGAGGTPATFTVTKNSGNYNTGLGLAALAYSRTGDYNTAVGYHSGQGVSNLQPSYYNDYTLFLGAYATSILDSGGTNMSAIGPNSFVGQSNSMSLGDTTVSTKVGIGTAYPDELLHVKGNIKVSGQVASPKQTVTYGTTITWDWNTGTNAEVTLTGNITTFNISNASPGTYATIKMIQDGTGSRLLSALPANSKVFNGGAGVITLSTAASSVDILTVYYDGTNYYWNYAKNYN